MSKREYPSIFSQTQHLSAASAAGTRPTTTATDGVAVPNSPDFTCQLLIEMNAAAAPLSCEVEIWGYNPTLSEWYYLDTTGTITAPSALTTFRVARRVDGASCFSRLYSRLVSTPGGTTPSYNTYFAFA